MFTKGRRGIIRAARIERLGSGASRSVCRINLRAAIVTGTMRRRTRLSSMIIAINVYLSAKLIISRDGNLPKKIFYAIHPFTVKLEAMGNEITKAIVSS